LPSYLKGDEHVEAVNIHELDTVSQAIVFDIEQADLVLVNSDFVKETLTFCGVPADRIIVNYLGVDEAFVKLIPQHEDPIRQEPPSHLKLLFAGFFGRRKGADVLLDALASASNVDWTLTIAGGIDPRVAQQYSEIMSSERVRVLGAVSRSRLAELMVEADLFVLPSRAEGSARVIFEALACACPVLTTPESGSIVKHHKHGFLVRRNSVSDIVEALQQADRDRGELMLMGEAAQSEVLSTFRQSHYGERLIAAYRDALSRCRQ
jgi:glycosyltransferase involved in cell wall biosynthesis